MFAGCQYQTHLSVQHHTSMPVLFRIFLAKLPAHVSRVLTASSWRYIVARVRTSLRVSIQDLLFGTAPASTLRVTALVLHHLPLMTGLRAPGSSVAEVVAKAYWLILDAMHQSLRRETSGTARTYCFLHHFNASPATDDRTPCPWFQRRRTHG